MRTWTWHYAGAHLGFKIENSTDDEWVLAGTEEVAQLVTDALNEKEARDEFRRMTPNYHALLDAEEAR